MSIYLYGRHDDRKFNVTIYICMVTMFRRLSLFLIFYVSFSPLDVKEGVYNFEEGEVNQV